MIEVNSLGRIIRVYETDKGWFRIRLLRHAKRSPSVLIGPDPAYGYRV